MRIGVLGATGPAGKGVAACLAAAGHHVVAGSRDRERAEGVVAELTERWGPRVETLVAGTNQDSAAAPDLVVIATKWDGAVATAQTHADALAGKVVIAMANGIERAGRELHAVLPDGGSVSAAVQAAAPKSRVVAAFQHVPAAAFGKLDEPNDCDVVCCGDDDAARTTVLDLVAGIAGLRAYDGGSLANALGIEAFAAVLLSVNLRHKGKGRLRLLGVEPHPFAGGSA